LFDPAYFLYGEDIELAIQTLRSGRSLVLAATSIVDHDLSSATGEAFRQRRYAEASLRLQMRHYLWLTPTALILGLMAGLARAVRDRQAMWLTERILGYWACLHSSDGRSPWTPLRSQGFGEVHDREHDEEAR
jgi:GT2 family glycosyltransferase